MTGGEKAAFVTKANLTMSVLERNKRVGVLIHGGNIPARIRTHLDALIASKVVRKQR